MTDDLSRRRILLGRVFSYIARILSPERDFYALAAIYGVGISLFSLALPISVQMLINTVANTGLVAPLAVLSLTLFALLLASGLLNALRIHLMEIFGRRFYARMTSEIALRAVYAANPFFHDSGSGPLFNRYFDMVVVQKSIPHLMIGGFTLALQALVGFVLVSLYHPLFLAFNIVFVLLMCAVLYLWGPSAILTAADLSHSKHKTAAWLEGLAGSNGFFKSKRHIAYALDRTDAETARYVSDHKRHFRQHFAQTIALLMIYATASASLLGLGGWLVINGQLTLGQLVAAELVLLAVFSSVAQLSSYLASFYDLCAAIDELSLFYDVKQEEPRGDSASNPADATLALLDVRAATRSGDALLNFEIPSGAKVMARAEDHGLQRVVSHLLRRHGEFKSGYILVGGIDIFSADARVLREKILIIDRPTMIEMSIREYLRIASDDATPEQILRVLQVVGLASVVSRLETGLDTNIAATGWPLSITESMQLKLAAAILARPRILVVNQLIDLIPEGDFEAILEHLREHPEMTFIYFSNRTRDLGFDLFLHLGFDKQEIYGSYDAFARRPILSPKILATTEAR